LVKGSPASPLLQVLAPRPSRGKRSHRANHNHSWMGSLGQVRIQPLARLLPPLVLVKANHAQRLTLHTSLGLLATKWANQRRIRKSSSNLAWQTCCSSRCSERILPRGNTLAVKHGCERCSIPKLDLRSNPCMKPGSALHGRITRGGMRRVPINVRSEVQGSGRGGAARLSDKLENAEDYRALAR
jgi:hypothetical protein